MLRPTNPADVFSLVLMQAKASGVRGQAPGEATGVRRQAPGEGQHVVVALGRHAIATGQGDSLPWSGLLEEWLLDRGRRHTWVSSRRGLQSGLVSCRPYKGRGSWEIDFLLLPQGDAAASLEVLEGLNQPLGKMGVERVVLRLEEDSLLREAAMDAGFAPMIRERLYIRRAAAHEMGYPGQQGPRPSRRDDIYPLYRLYCDAVPVPVRHMEGLTLGDWQQAPTRGELGAKQRWVVERGDALAAALTLARGSGKRKLVEVLTNPRCPAPINGLLAAAVRSEGARSTLLCLLPEFLWLQDLEEPLERAGFQESGVVTVYVKPVLARVRSNSLMPARPSTLCV